MNKTLGMLLHLLICVIVSFVAIYIFVFLGGWRLFESGDPILVEVGIAFGIGSIVWIIFELYQAIESKIRGLEERISELESKK